MDVRTGNPEDADLLVTALREGEDPPVRGAKPEPGHVAVTGEGLVVGVGAATSEDVRVAAAAAVRRARERAAASLGWAGPEPAAFVEGAVLAAYAFTEFKSEAPEPALEALVVAEDASE